MAKAKFPLTLASGAVFFSPPDAIAPHDAGTAIHINGASVVVPDKPAAVMAALAGEDTDQGAT
jgi:hypothetical protein